MSSLLINKLYAATPTPLTKCGNSNIINYQVSAIRAAYPLADIIVSAGRNANKVAEKLPAGVRLIENLGYDKLGEIGELRLLLNASIHSKVVIIDGRNIFDWKFINDIPRNGSYIITNDKPNKEAVCVSTTNNQVVNIDYGLSYEFMNMVCLQNKELSFLRKFCNNVSKENLFLFEGLKHILNYKSKIYRFDVNNTTGKLIKIVQS